MILVALGETTPTCVIRISLLLANLVFKCPSNSLSRYHSMKHEGISKNLNSFLWYLLFFQLANGLRHVHSWKALNIRAIPQYAERKYNEYEIYIYIKFVLWLVQMILLVYMLISLGRTIETQVWFRSSCFVLKVMLTYCDDVEKNSLVSDRGFYFWSESDFLALCVEQRITLTLSSGNCRHPL